MRSYRSFSWKDTNLRIACEAFDLVTRSVVAQRKLLERYIGRHPEFQTSLVPVVLLEEAPEVARRMAAAADRTGLGPMASVAGTLAQLGVEAAMAAGCREAIVENGGDIFILSESAVTIAIYAGNNVIGNKLAFRIAPHDLPLSLCSSSGKMGHSLSLGHCDLATVTSRDAALADSAVTLVCNLIRSEKDLTPVLNDVGTIAGITGIFAVKNGKIGMWGHLPELVRNEDAATQAKITRDLRSAFKDP
jgi:ApbE superfamily uncharacterized protein (UPF0280 family)